MGFYRKKPVEIEAHMFTGRVSRLPEEFQDQLHTCGCGANAACSLCGKTFIKTLEGNMIVSKGDYIIKGVKGEFYPCKPDIFLSTYEDADSNWNDSGCSYDY